jgi:hypothetical protein
MKLPTRVKVIIWVFYIVLVINFVESFFAIPLLVETLPEMEEYKKFVNPVTVLGVIAVIGHLFNFILIWMISKKKNWARITYLIIILLNFPTVIGNVITETPSFLFSYLNLLFISIKAVGIVLLFVGEESKIFTKNTRVTPSVTE